MYAEISAALQSARALSDLLKSAQSLTNYNELVAAVSNVNAKLIDAQGVALSGQEKQFSLSERVRELENRIAESEDWKRKVDRYELKNFPTGALAYALKGAVQAGETAHYLCAACMDKRAISILQPVGRSYFLYCHGCKLRIMVKECSGAMLQSLQHEMARAK